MNTEDRAILSKMNKLIETSSAKHKAICERYISLANKRLNSLRRSTPEFFGVIGASMAIEGNFKSKFGSFLIRRNPIRLN